MSAIEVLEYDKFLKVFHEDSIAMERFAKIVAELYATKHGKNFLDYLIKEKEKALLALEKKEDDVRRGRVEELNKFKLDLKKYYKGHGYLGYPKKNYGVLVQWSSIWGALCNPRAMTKVRILQTP